LIGKKLIKQEVHISKLGNWNANIFYLQRRKCLILMNDITYYSLLFLDIQKADLLKFSELFYQRLIEQFDFDKIDFPLECSAKLINETSAQFLTTNNNRKVLGTMKQFVLDLDYYFYYDYNGQISNINVKELNHRLTNNLVGALKPKKSDFGRPIEEMKKKLEEICI